MKYSKSFFTTIISMLLMSIGTVKAEVFSAETSQVGGAGHTVTVAMSVIAKRSPWRGQTGSRVRIPSNKGCFPPRPRAPGVTSRYIRERIQTRAALLPNATRPEG